MSEQENLFKTMQGEFKKYLNESGVIEALVDVLAKLYELEIKPTDPLDYIRTNMTETVKEKEELKELKTKHDQLITQIQEMEEKNMNLAKAIKELENYSGELNEFKLVIE